VISPDSVRSDFCKLEVNHAVELTSGRFEEGVALIIAAIETDLEWERQHTRLTVKALEWDDSGRDRSFLLRGSELAAAEQWLAAGVDKDPGRFRFVSGFSYSRVCPAS
jgi:hypothetical protein